MYIPFGLLVKSISKLAVLLMVFEYTMFPLASNKSINAFLSGISSSIILICPLEGFGNIFKPIFHL